MKNNKESFNPQKENISIRTLLVMTMADIDIFLLQNEEQTADKIGVYTKEQIREQLENTAAKMCTTLEDLGCNIDEELKFSEFNKMLNAKIY